MNFDKLIKQLKVEKPKDKEEAEEMKQDIKAFLMLKEIKEKKVKTKVDFEKANKALCFKSLSYCCDIGNPCVFRNAVLDSLGISMKEFRERKKKWHEKLRGDFVGK